MILSELLSYVGDQTGQSFIHSRGELIAETDNPLCSEIGQAIMQGCGCQDTSCSVLREQVVTALGPIRLRFMADDAPVEGFRLVENVVLAIDKAFNDEALRQKGAS